MATPESTSTKSWYKKPPPPAGFSKVLGLSPFQSHLLYNRGLRDRSEVDAFLAADSSLMHDPMLLPDMDRGVARLAAALDSGEAVGVFGDFDTDGITGTALLVRALRDLGGTVVSYLPDRVLEGHGLNEQAVRRLGAEGVSLLVTVDCGTDSVAEVELAASMGMDAIITDHHTLPDIPPVPCALINPQRSDSEYPYPHLTGVGMSFKLAQALYSHLGRPEPEHLLELVALGTVADVGPMTGENRYLVKRGLERLNATQSPGLQALAAEARLKLGAVNAESLAFGLIPRLNAAGRLDHPSVSLDLLTAQRPEEAQALAARLELKNSERRSLSDQCVRDAERQVEAEIDFRGAPSMIVVSDGEWIPGVLGLIAGNISESYYRPTVAVSIGEEISRASARSIPEFDMVGALRECGDLFTRFGGHPRAAGFTAPTASLAELKRTLQGLADQKLAGLDLRPRIAIDCEASPALFSGGNLEFIQSLEPFGEGNPAPVFLTRNARVTEARRVGGDGQHLKLWLRHGGGSWNAIAFRQGERLDSLEERIDLVYTVGQNTWRDETKLQLTVLDFASAGRYQRAG